MPRSSCILLGLLFALGMASSAAEDLPKQYPERSIKILVGFAAGGGTDVAARIVAQKLTETLGQSVVVENRPGASGMIAAETVAKSGADGYTLMMGTQTTLAVAPALYRKFSIDATRDFVGVAKAGVSPLVLVVHPSVPARSVMDLIALAKASPGTINFGSGGLGTTPHMAGELFSIQAGIKMVHVAYRGEAPAINDLLGGQLHLIFANLSAVIGNVKAGSLRALAVTSAQRAATAPEIPTVAEAALPGFEAATWFALVAPAGTPREIVRRLNRELTQVMTQPDVRQRFADLGMTIDAGPPEALDAYIKSEILKWSKVIKEADIRAPD
ncbi:MAG TPA: tripartite tricarboxylate transporter substrate binding protein [Xanthobacteraceae bacterium]|nr:tripartite tricarboxylate transporter substrate binding protein [Xanthobacteraceae bacterium]